MVALAACGAGDDGPIAPDPKPIAVETGDNWDFRPQVYVDRVFITSQVVPGLHELTGSLDLAGTTVTAHLAVWGYCINDVRTWFTGTRSGSDIDMKGIVDGVTIQVQGTLSPDSENFSGSYTVGGGSCGQSSAPAPMLGQRVYVGGTWSDDNVTLELVVDTIPLEGGFRLSGTATITNDACLPEGTISNITRGRLVFPDLTSGGNRYLMNAEISRDGQQMVYYYWPERGSCTGSGGGTLTRR